MDEDEKPTPEDEIELAAAKTGCTPPDNAAMKASKEAANTMKKTKNNQVNFA